ncbi:MAG: sigma-70 family RNA polymerase sigma factor [Proteocatella sp.]
MKREADAMSYQEQFDSFCKKILKNHARNYAEQLRRRERRECSFEGACEDRRVQQYFSTPPYEGAYIFRVMNMDVVVKNLILGAALDELEDEKRDIVLLSYFIEMTDQEIAEYLHLIRRTVSYRRGSTLKQLKKFLETYSDE